MWLSSVQVRIGGTMHPCLRLAKRPVQRRKAAISLLGEREFYEDFEDVFLTPQGTIYLWLLKVRPRWSLPLLLLSILNMRPGKCRKILPLLLQYYQFWQNSIDTKIKLKELICDQEEEDCQHCYSGPGASSKICYCYSGRGVMLLVFAVIIVIQAFECFKQGCGLWLKKN